MTNKTVFNPSDASPPPGKPIDPDLRDYLETNSDIVTRVTKPVSLRDVGALTAQSEYPIVFENIIERPGFRICDMLVRNRKSQGRALGVAPELFVPTLAYRLRKPPRPFVHVTQAPVKEVKWLGNEVDLGKLPVPYHKEGDELPYITAMNILRDPETGFYNSGHAGTTVTGPREALISFATPHSLRIMRKYRQMGAKEMPIAICVGVPPAYEIMANFSGLHLDQWGEMEMTGTIMDQDIEMIPCETIELNAPARAEMIIEGWVDLEQVGHAGAVTSPSMYRLPQRETIPRLRVTAVTMRRDRPIWRNHQTTPQTDHQPLPRLCHEAMLYNRLREMGCAVHDVRFPTWGAALSVLMSFDYPWEGFVNDALMMAMGAPWLNTKLVVALSPDTNLDDAAEVYQAIATRADPARDYIMVPGTRGSPYDPSAQPLPDNYPFRLVGKMGIDATRKKRHDAADFDRAWPMNWGKVRLEDFL